MPTAVKTLRKIEKKNRHVLIYTIKAHIIFKSIWEKNFSLNETA